MQPTRETTEILNEMFEKNEFEWVELDDNLPSTTKEYLALIQDYVEVKMHIGPIQGIYVFSINHPVVKYLIHDPGISGHMWGDAKFENLDNNAALSAIWGEPRMKKLFDGIDKEHEASSE
jgi:hypothetical protein